MGISGVSCQKERNIIWPYSLCPTAFIKAGRLDSLETA